MLRGLAVFAGIAIAAAAQGRHIPPPPGAASRIDLEKNWTIQTSAKVGHDGAAIASPGFGVRGWLRTHVPTTVVRAMVDNGLYPDPYYGLNLRLIPGTTYDFGDNFAVDPMPADSPFRDSWWYRTEFKLPPGLKGRRLWLNFDAINQRANIWLNGRQIATSDQAVGMYRRFEFDVTDVAVAGGDNVLAVEVIAPTENDLSITFVDWNPLPADKDMGLVLPVYILATGPVAMRNVQVATSLENTLDLAHLTLYADLKNASAQQVDGTLQGTIGAITVSKPVRLAAGESATVSLTPAQYPQLDIRNPGLWWPYGIGEQNLYQLHMEFRTGGAISDRQDAQFGIRQFTSELDAQQHRVFRINGKRILIRGAGWTNDIVLRVSDERTDYEVRYAREMNLNTLRLEGKMLDQHFYDVADQLGVMVMPGWCCCSYWEQWEKWKPEDYTVAADSLRDQLRMLRNHASVFVFLYGSDNAPPADVERMYLNVMAEERWPNPTLASATDSTTPGAGRTGVKMTGPYDYVSPNYWLLDTKQGGAFGFITETGPGPAIPLLPSLQQMMPAEYLWPIDNQVWNFHAGSGSFADTRLFTAALEGRHGKARDLSDYVRKSQAMTYEAERAMFEAYGRNKYTSTGVIQWMFNNAWPGLIWHLYDWYLRPGGGYFGTKKANEPLHVQYSYDDNSIVVVNSLYADLPGYSVTAKVYNLDLTEMYSRTAAIDIGQDSAARVFYLPQIAGLSRTFFLKLTLSDPDGAVASTNWYWLSTQPDVIDWSGGDYRYKPIQTYADLTGLDTLPPAKVTAAWRSEDAGAERIEHVTVQNVSSQLAFLVHLTVLKGKGGPDVAPVWWEDNYFELMPGETREIAVRYPRKLLGGAEPYVQVDGWNLQ